MQDYLVQCIDRSEDCIAIFDLEKKLLYFNSAFAEEIVSFYEGHLEIGKTLSQCVPKYPEVVARTYKMIDICWDKKKPIATTFHLTAKLGIQKYYSTYNPIRDEAHSIVGCGHICRKVRNNSQTDLLERKKTKSQLEIFKLKHDIQNLMGAVMGFSELENIEQTRKCALVLNETLNRYFQHVSSYINKDNKQIQTDNRFKLRKKRKKKKGSKKESKKESDQP